VKCQRRRDREAKGVESGEGIGRGRPLPRALAERRKLSRRDLGHAEPGQK